LGQILHVIGQTPNWARDGPAMTTASEARRYQQLLEEKQAPLLHLLRRQDHIAKRELAIRNLGRGSSRLHVVTTALRSVPGSAGEAVMDAA
jgi:hypothetical protein